MTLNTRITAIKIAAAALLIGPGIIMVTGPITPLSGLVDAFLDFAHQPIDGAQKVTNDGAHLLNAILGGVLAGFGVMVWVVAERVYRNDQPLGQSLILIPLFTWFVCDSTGSILAGAWFNAIINIAIIAAFVAPFYWPSKTTMRPAV